jgi:hypothetical protein
MALGALVGFAGPAIANEAQVLERSVTDVTATSAKLKVTSNVQGGYAWFVVDSTHPSTGDGLADPYSLPENPIASNNDGVLAGVEVEDLITGLVPGGEYVLFLKGFNSMTAGYTLVFRIDFRTAINPTFGEANLSADGFTVVITNFQALEDFTLAATATLGEVTISEAGLVTVTGLADGEEATVTVTSTRENFPTGTGTKSGTATAAANDPAPTPPSSGSGGGGAVVAPPVQAPVATPVVAPVRTPTEAFAANSATLTKELRVSIRKALAVNPNAKAAICRGFVASGAASAADRKLARDRSTAVCNRITRVNPDLDVEVKKVVVASSSKQLRKVRMVLR